MPINKGMMKSMKSEYGKKAGKNIYYATEEKMKKDNPKEASKVYKKK